jgi:hypothetical protein
VAVIHDTACPLPVRAEDEHPPAPVISADLRTGQVNSAISFRCGTIKPEKRACLGTFMKDAYVKKQFNLVRVNVYFRFFPGVFIPDDEMKISVVFYYRVNKSEVTTAFPALGTFECQKINRTGYRVFRLFTLISPV